MTNWTEVLGKVSSIVESWEESGYQARRSGRFISDGCSVEVTRDWAAKTLEIVIKESTQIEDLRG